MKALSFNEYLTLLSDVSDEKLEEMAKQAQELTNKFFGKTILLYAPLYLSNECNNHCVYCGFREGEGITLSVEEALKEAEILYQKGFRHILLVSGEKRDKVTIDYLKEIISKIHQKFESISLEIFPLEEDEYRELVLAGADGLTLYQEVYDRDEYKKFHPCGLKSDYDFRFQAPERAAKAGFYRINIGTLLGLADWRKEAAALGQHIMSLKRRFWRTQFAISFPRLKGFPAPQPVSDRQLVQMLCALRIFQPSIGLVLSTRESKELRDNLISLGITQMSAESKTSPGGYSEMFQTVKQFEVSDERSLEEVSLAIASKGYEPVFKDWDKSYIGRK